MNVSVGEELYRRVVEAIPEGIWVVDPQGLTIFSNRRMAEILRADFEAMPKVSCFDSVFPEDLADAQRHFACSLAACSRISLSVSRLKPHCGKAKSASGTWQTRLRS